jgi:hypothetical protein
MRWWKTNFPGITRELVMAFGYVFIVLVIIAVIYAYISASQEEVEYVKSSLDGRIISSKMDNSQDAANVIASVTADMVSLVKHMAAKFPHDPDVKRLVDNFDPAAVWKDPLRPDTPDTVDKGAKWSCVYVKTTKPELWSIKCRSLRSDTRT